METTKEILIREYKEEIKADIEVDDLGNERIEGLSDGADTDYFSG